MVASRPAVGVESVHPGAARLDLQVAIEQQAGGAGDGGVRRSADELEDGQVSFDPFGVGPGPRSAIQRRAVVAHLIEGGAGGRVDAMAFGQRDKRADLVDERDLGEPRVVREDPGPLELVTRFDDASLVAGDALPVVSEVLAERPAVEEPLAESRTTVPRAIEKALVARRLERREAGFDQMHVRVLQTRTLGGDRVQEALGAGPLQMPLDEVERVVRAPERVGIAAGAIPPGEREERKRLVVEVGGRVEDRAVRCQPAGPATIGTLPRLLDEIRVAALRQGVARPQPSSDACENA